MRPPPAPHSTGCRRWHRNPGASARLSVTPTRSTPRRRRLQPGLGKLPLAMSHRVCPWWLGYLLASPLRRLFQDPVKLLSPYVRAGMTVLEPGPGMGFFTLDLARLVGPGGHVVAVDIQPKMLSSLQRRLVRAGLLERVDARLVPADSMRLAGLAG